MKKIYNPFNLLKVIFKTSYDTTKIIDPETKKLNKKSLKVWLYGLLIALVFFISYTLIRLLKEYNQADIFLDIFFYVLSILIMFETVFLSLSVMYFSDDLEQYMCLPIPSFKLFFTKYAVMLSIIMVSEALIAMPSLIIYGAMTAVKPIYYISVISALILITIFITSIINLMVILLVKIFKFIKNKSVYQNLIIFIVSFFIFYLIRKSIENAFLSVNIEELKEITGLKNLLPIFNEKFIITSMGVNAIKMQNLNSFIEIIKMFGMSIGVLTVLLFIGKLTFVKDALRISSTLEKKKRKKIKLKKTIGKIHKKSSYIKNEIKMIIKTPTYLRHYIYNIIILLVMFKLLFNLFYPMAVQMLLEIGEEAYEAFDFNFRYFSLIIALIQILFTFSPLSLTAFSRYGKMATFFKTIPINLKTQFRLKNAPQIILNTIIITSIISTIYKQIPTLDTKYYIELIIASMLLNIINSYISLMIELKRPQLNYENEISIVKQNENRLFQYIQTAVMCFIIWYLYKVTENISVNTAILIEIGVFSFIFLVLEFIISKKKNKIFNKII